MTEEWKTIEDYPNYSVSNLGRVRNDKTGKILKLGKSGGYGGRQYSHIILWGDDHTYKGFSVHRLVASAFIPNPGNKPEVNHIDGDHFNNVISNLEWSTRLENIEHSHAVLHPKRIMRIEDNKVFNNAEEAARASGLKSPSSILHCVRGGRYRQTAGGYHWRYYE